MCNLTCTSAGVWARLTEPLDFYPQSHQTGRAPLSECVAYLKTKRRIFRVDKIRITRDKVVGACWEQCLTSQNGNSVGLHHEEGQQMENDGWTRGRVVLEAHSGHQVNEESIALLPELSVLLDVNPTQNETHIDVNNFGLELNNDRRNNNEKEWFNPHAATHLMVSEGTMRKSSSIGWMQSGQNIWPGTNHCLMQATQ